MKRLLILVTALSLTGVAHGEETVGEKAKSTTQDVKRSMKKGAHRVKEAVCAEGDMKCLGEKAKHRAEEGKDFVKDKATETKDKVD